MSDRNIKVTFYVDASKGHLVSGSTRWYKYARNASMKAFDTMVQNIWGAGVCEIYDDELGKLLYQFAREIGSNSVTCVFDHEVADNELYTAQCPAQFKNFVSKKSKLAKARKPKTNPKK